jgi:hypothetical protein
MYTKEYKARNISHFELILRIVGVDYRVFPNDIACRFVYGMGSLKRFINTILKDKRGIPNE